MLVKVRTVLYNVIHTRNLSRHLLRDGRSCARLQNKGVAELILFMKMRVKFSFPVMKDKNWYPGHMAKGMRLTINKIQRCNCVIEVHDARISLIKFSFIIVHVGVVTSIYNI